jgi:thiamine kinase-like enzyme
MAGSSQDLGVGMKELVDEKLNNFLRKNGVTDVLSYTQILAGRNSEVYKITSLNRSFILKKYSQSNHDKRDRLGAEFGFLAYLENLNISMVARPLAIDQEQNIALYSYLIGSRVTDITSMYISQAAEFIRVINLSSSTPLAMKLPMASDACLSWQDHLKLVKLRIERLQQLQPVNKLEKEVQEFVVSKLIPKWLQLNRNIEVEMAKLDNGISSSGRIISPSDFGFHNILENQGQLYFLDFEYAGWDDPVKLICDFICQPELAVSQSQGEQFLLEVSGHLPQPEKIKQFVQLLLPIHRLKWCCILLNEFRLEDRCRRLHAGISSQGLLAGQISKATWYFNKHLNLLT